MKKKEIQQEKRFPEKGVWTVFAIIAIVYLTVLSQGITIELSDQGVYYYMGKLISEGVMPYRDFFFSHPPLEIFVDALAFTFFGFNFFVLKFISILATIVSAVYILKIVKPRFGMLAGLFSVLFFLFNYEVLRLGSGNIGMSLAIMFVLMGAHNSLMKKHFAAGLFFGLACLTNFHSFVPTIIFFTIPFVKRENDKIRINPKQFLRFLAGFLLTFGLITIILLIIAGMEYILQVFKYHLLKPEVTIIKGLKLDLFKKMMAYNPVIFIGWLLFFFCKKKRELSTLWGSALLYVLFLLALKRIFPYYFDMMFPFLAILAGIGIGCIITKLPKSKNTIVVALLLIVFIAGYFAAGNYLWIMNNSFKNDEHINVTQIIIRNTAMNDTIFGDYLVVPLVAVLSNRKISLNFVDTNPLRFQAGLVDVEKLVEGLNKEKPAYIILRKSNPLLRYNASKEFLNANCIVTNVFDFELPTYFDRRTVSDNLYVLACD